MSRFQRWDAHGFTYIFGDEILFCDNVCREMNLENHIAHTLTENQYDLVLIYDKAKGFRYPVGQEAKMDSVYEKITGQKIFPNAPSSASTILGRRRGLFSNASASSNTETPPVLRERRVIWDRDVVPTFDALLRRPRRTDDLENMRIAIVMMNMRSFLDEAIADFNSFFDTYKTRMGNDAFILCFNGYTPQTAHIEHEESRAEKYLTEWFQSINENSGLNANIIELSTPPQSEVRNFLNRRRLTRQLNVPASQLDELTEKVFRFTRSEKISLASLGVRIHDWQQANGLHPIEFNLSTFNEIIGVKRHDKTSKQMLNELIGLSHIRDVLNGIENLVRNAGINNDVLPYQPRFFEANSINKPNLKLHFALKGNPGTGKTTVAELLGRYLYEIGALTSGHVVKCVANDLMADHVGGTAIKVSDKINDALGGVLFIDEISAIAGKKDEFNRGGNNHAYAKELNSVLLNAMTSYPDLSIVIAGYPDDVESFISSDSGFPRRFSHIVLLPDYNARELADIFRLKAKNSGLKIANDLDEILVDFMQNWLMQKPSDNTWGNAGEVENLLLNIGMTIDADNVIKIKDIPKKKIVGKNYYDLDECLRNSGSNIPSPTQKLDSLIGLSHVKDKIKSISNLIEFNKKRGRESRPSLNFVFIGNPGTGKTTVAKILGEILAKIGALEKSRVVEVTREDLVGPYMGQTEAIVKQVFNSALGGVLFIDEAYSLAGKGAIDYGGNVIEALVKFSDENRGKVCIILAGYSFQMRSFLRNNSGLSSRFMAANQIEFSNYSHDELFDIFKYFCSENEYVTNEAFDMYLRKCITAIVHNIRDDFGNGREMRNLFENCEYAMSTRLMEADNEGDLNEFVICDLANAMGMMKMQAPPVEDNDINLSLFRLDKTHLIEISEKSKGIQYDEETLEEAVIFITTDQQTSGSGFIITNDGYAITCAHVIKNTNFVTARIRIKDRRGTNHDTEHSCTIVVSNEEYDIAIIKLDAERTPYVPILLESETVERGQDIHLFGYPFGSRFDNLSLFRGTVSSYQTVNEVETILLNIEGKQGCSGGMCIDPKTGYVVGVFAGSYTKASSDLTEEVQYARPIKYLWSMIEER